MATGDGRQNGGLPTIAVSRALLATAPGRRKLDLIMNAPNPRAFIRQLPAEDLYFAIREIGLSDAADIIALASPNQFRALVDLDAWSGGLPDPSMVLSWLELSAEGSNDGEFRAQRSALDPEIILLVLMSQTIVHPLEEEEDPVLTSNNYVRSAEGKYIIEIIAEGADGVTTRRLIEDFIDENPFTATRLFESVRWESKTELEETSLRWRTGRMRDMGFPELEEAIRVWAPLPVGWKPRQEPVEPGPIAGVPALLLVTSRARLFLDRVVERLPDDDRPYFNEGLIYLLNCAIVADGIDPKELDHARDTLAAARDMLSLGLELSCGGSEDAALGILGATPATELFRVAVTRIATLSHAANEAAKAVSFGTASATALDSPEAEIVAGLRRKRPRLYDPVPAGAPPRFGGDWRAFRDSTDLALAEAALQRVRAVGAALTEAGLDRAVIARLSEAAGRASTAVTVSQLLLTAALHHASGLPPPLVPLNADRVRDLCRLFQAGRLEAGARARLWSFFDTLAARLDASLRPHFAEIADRAVARFEDEIGSPCATGGIEPQYVEAVLVAGPLGPPAP